jgi:hypothetical protein
MAFGKSSGRSFGPNAKLYYVKLKTKDLPEPLFEVKLKKGEKDYEIVDPAARFVSGNIIDIQNRETKHEKKTIKSVSVTMQDGDEYYFVGIPHTYLGRNILNSLLGLKTFNGVEIGVYQSKPKPDPKDPNKMRPGFASSAVRQAGKLVYGKFKQEELPKIEKVKVGNELFSDTTAIEAFLIKQVEELGKVVKDNAPAGVNTGNPSATANVAVPASTGDQSAEGEDNDLPF